MSLLPGVYRYCTGGPCRCAMLTVPRNPHFAHSGMTTLRWRSAGQTLIRPNVTTHFCQHNNVGRFIHGDQPKWNNAIRTAKGIPGLGSAPLLVARIAVSQSINPARSIMNLTKMNSKRWPVVLLQWRLQVRRAEASSNRLAEQSAL
jgi:hypothetical protein